MGGEGTMEFLVWRASNGANKWESMVAVNEGEVKIWSK